jgi:hypothetical protein
MKRMKLFVSGAGLLLLVAGSPRIAAATTISYLATDLSDTVAGDDLWQYDYFVSGIAFDADQGFSVGFARSLYTDLESPPPAVSADWDILTLQPDPGIPEDGLYDALALVAGAAATAAVLLRRRATTASMAQVPAPAPAVSSGRDRGTRCCRAGRTD